jgi:S-adenosylmethionine synthetase
MKKGKSLKKVSGEVRETIETELANIDKFTEELVNQSISVC